MYICLKMRRHTQGTHMLRYILLARRSQKQTSQQKASLYWKAETLGEHTTQTSNFPLKGKDGNGEEMGEKMWNRLSIYTGPKTGVGGISQDFSTVLCITDTHKFNKIINRILSCRSPLIQPLSHSWARRPLTHEGLHVWWGTPSPVKPT